MADKEVKYLGQEATEQLIQNAKITATQKVADHNTASDAHSDIRTELTNTVRVTAQTLTDEQKSQARANIGADQVTVTPLVTTGSYLATITINGTDTDLYTPKTGITAGASGTTANSATTDPYVKIKDNSNHRSQIRLKGSDATTVESDANGNITVSSTDNKVKQVLASANSNYPLLLGNTFQSETTTGFAYFNSEVYMNPSLKRVYADISGTATNVRNITSGNFLVGNGNANMVEKTPSEVLTLIGGVTETRALELINEALGVIENGTY